MPPSAVFHFPPGFLWGCATAAHQVEGGNTLNNWHAWEQQPGRILNGDRSGLACNWWGGRWKDDLDRAAQGGQNAHRLSVEWSRIQPRPDVWCEDAIDHYRQILRGMLERGLKPLVTLHHFTDPLWISEAGGWENDATPAHFERFTRKVVEAFKEYVNGWVTINEPNVLVFEAYIDGLFPPGKQDMAAAFQAAANLMRGHAATYRTLHSLQPGALAGITTNYRSVLPARRNFPLDVWLTGYIDKTFNHTFNRVLVDGKLAFLGRRLSIPEAAHTQDYIGIDYYTRDLLRFVLSPKKMFLQRDLPPGALRSTHNFIANVPEGMWEALKWARRFNLPILVSENGVEDSTDTIRPRYLVEHLRQVWRAVNFNWPVLGYFHWSLVDNFEWERGWSQRFGLWGLDPATQVRTRRPSVDLYAAICKENGISSEMVRQYAPDAFAGMFPG